ncbi:sn-glycerol-3-phosphate ABC transporter ATP-binding protein UgpC [Neorhizobium sp. Rsf11]|uniref:Sn-glycerol-3-phosphate ABC transporter ATP-binding protein UgpC n=2 Tax=Neorhizobium TaxID=1525371 RepID=A0ABV0ME07_9HYPH|nr:sn-glycerol-3-phosphate ABC transporter ATP-binding protein UgpC [Neorhizobium petrolearium]MCC2613819.1 sn-glycerol-3-phosphate ABC transporter ATP-binding protein UgpC [Neorhizobium petrolearium]WGI72128.1 sn-glycerol-3-phosphate ABC transporter ATP-binding protein UgpC [Neorhizobium petrolearium]
MARVEISQLEKSYDDSEVVRGIDIDIPDGEFVVLVGPSGCGKSTLLRMIAGLESVTDGEIRIGDTVVNDIAAKDRDIAMVFQNYALYPHMTVAENMSFALKLKGEAKPAIEQAVKRASSILGLDALLARYPKQLSGGQRQRVAMGRAIVRDPKVFLFDEPLSNLDAKLRVQMRSEIKELHQRLKTTTIYVTHDQIEAMTMADRIVVMQGGIVEQVGAPLELYDKPANVFVATFIGSPSMNLYSGTAEAGDGGLVMRTQEDVVMPLPSGRSDLAGRRIVYGIRPEDIVVGAGPGVVASISTIEPTGAETLLLCKVGSVNTVVVSRERVRLGPGDDISLIFPIERLHLFDEATGRRI